MFRAGVILSTFGACSGVDSAAAEAVVWGRGADGVVS